jgi:geranylgeranyl diphosphate synthase type I
MGWEDTDGGPADFVGKALRSSLCLLACETTGGGWRRALPAAAAVELVHNFSLVHDDIQDQDRERRHRPTVWAVWGEAQAINAGDALLSLARLAVLKLADEDVPAATVVEAAKTLDERTLEMVEGQVLDLGLEGEIEVDLSTYLGMIEKKTGALFDCALSLGALVGSDESRIHDSMGRFGRLLGVAFQVRDDMLGVWGAENRTGKAPAADIRRRKKSLPVVYALSRAEGATLDELRRAYGKPEFQDSDISLVLRCLDAMGAQDYCRRLAEEKKEAAFEELDRADLRPRASAELREAASYLLDRDF